MTPMSRLFIMVALCVLPAMVSAGRPFWLDGIVYCDTCRCGFETSATYNIKGAVVMVECRNSTNMDVVYTSKECTTDENGKWEMQVMDDHQDQLCNSVLVSSSMKDCKTADPVRRKASVMLTRSNGAISDRHFVNSMGFWNDKELPECKNILAQYKLNSETWRI